MERIGQLEQDIYSAVAQSPRRIETEFQRRGWFSFTHPNTRTRPNNFSILLSSRYPVISHHLYVFSRFTGYPLRYGSWKTYDTSFQFSSTYFLSRTFFHFLPFFVASQAKCKYLFFFPTLKQGKSTCAHQFDYFNFRFVLSSNFVRYFLRQLCDFTEKRLKKIYIYIKRNIFFLEESYFLFIHGISRFVMMCLYRIELFTSCLQITKVSHYRQRVAITALLFFFFFKESNVFLTRIQSRSVILCLHWIKLFASNKNIVSALEFANSSNHYTA